MIVTSFASERAVLACRRCRERKKACKGGFPCQSCLHRKEDCVPGDVVDGERRSKKILQQQLQQQHLLQSQQSRTAKKAQKEEILGLIHDGQHRDLLPGEQKRESSESSRAVKQEEVEADDFFPPVTSQSSLVRSTNRRLLLDGFRDLDIPTFGLSFLQHGSLERLLAASGQEDSGLLGAVIGALGALRLESPELVASAKQSVRELVRDSYDCFTPSNVAGLVLAAILFFSDEKRLSSHYVTTAEAMAEGLGRQQLLWRKKRQRRLQHGCKIEEEEEKEVNDSVEKKRFKENFGLEAASKRLVFSTMWPGVSGKRSRLSSASSFDDPLDENIEAAEEVGSRFSFSEAGDSEGSDINEIQASTGADRFFPAPTCTEKKTSESSSPLTGSQRSHESVSADSGLTTPDSVRTSETMAASKRKSSSISGDLEHLSIKDYEEATNEVVKSNPSNTNEWNGFQMLLCLCSDAELRKPAIMARLKQEAMCVAQNPLRSLRTTRLLMDSELTSHCENVRYFRSLPHEQIAQNLVSLVHFVSPLDPVNATNYINICNTACQLAMMLPEDEGTKFIFLIVHSFFKCVSQVNSGDLIGAITTSIAASKFTSARGERASMMIRMICEDLCFLASVSVAAGQREAAMNYAEIFRTFGKGHRPFSLAVTQIETAFA